MTVTEAFTIIGNASFVFTVGIVYLIYTRQKKDSEEAAKRETRVRLTQAYVRLNAETLRSERNINAKRELLYPEYIIHQAELIEFMLMILNTLRLEWDLYKLFHAHSKDDFYSTLERYMRPLAKNIAASSQNRFLIFEKIFADFPDDFKEAVVKSMRRP